MTAGVDPAPASGNLLVVYWTDVYPLRGSVRDHLFSFRHHSERRVFYLNLAFRTVPRAFRRMRFDAVIFHTTFLSGRWSESIFDHLLDRARPLKGVGGRRIALPQDEFFQTAKVSEFIEEFGVDAVFSVAPESEWPKIYPSVDRARVDFHQVLTGYLGEDTVERVDEIVEATHERPLAIGYRAWHAAPWLGRHGQLKTRVAKEFERAASERGLAVDISTRAEDTLLGDDWLRFLASCRYTIGVEGGASVLDADGRLRTATDAYLEQHPGASFEEVEEHCFPGRDGEIDLKALSPRHLEACATRTCQVLVEGEYNGVLRAGEHYLALNQDLSNLDEVVDLIACDELREGIVDAAYRDVVASGDWTYARLVADIERAVPPYDASREPSGSSLDSFLCRLNDAVDKTSAPRARYWVPLRGRLGAGLRRLLRR